MANIEKMHEEKKVLSFEHPIQRQSEQWTNQQKSLLIHSMLANYPVPNIYVLREDSQEVDSKNKPIFNYFVMDGKQRLTSVLSYIWGEFPLDDNIPNICVEEEEYEIAGKYFSDLDEPVQYEITRYKFELVCFEECTDREIEEIFYRLNNSTPLTKAQVAKSKIGVQLAEMMNELLTSKFFTTSCNFSKAQRKASDDQRSLIQAMMLLDTNNVPDFELKDFSENSILEYSENIRENYSDKQKNILESAIQYLTDAFPEKNKNIRKISIPMLIYLADIAQDVELKPRFFREWWSFFTEEDELMEVYKTFCSSGSTKLEKIKGRLAIMTKSFCLYHEIDIPEELKEMVIEVEEKVAAKEESDNNFLIKEEETMSEENIEVISEFGVIETTDEQEAENVDVEDEAIDTSETEDLDNVEDARETFKESTEETECENSADETSNEEDSVPSDFEIADC